MNCFSAREIWQDGNRFTCQQIFEAIRVSGGNCDGAGTGFILCHRVQIAARIVLESWSMIRRAVSLLWSHGCFRHLRLANRCLSTTRPYRESRYGGVLQRKVGVYCAHIMTWRSKSNENDAPTIRPVYCGCQLSAAFLIRFPFTIGGGARCGSRPSHLGARTRGG